MSKFKKKPVIIDAIQWNGKNIYEIDNFLGDNYQGFLIGDNPIKVNTLEGVLNASVNDWIIKGINGEFYPCKPDIFDKTYEAV